MYNRFGLERFAHSDARAAYILMLLELDDVSNYCSPTYLLIRQPLRTEYKRSVRVGKSTVTYSCTPRSPFLDSWWQFGLPTSFRKLLGCAGQIKLGVVGDLEDDLCKKGRRKKSEQVRYCRATCMRIGNLRVFSAISLLFQSQCAGSHSKLAEVSQ